jgi:hypothetical protein
MTVTQPPANKMDPTVEAMLRNERDALMMRLRWIDRQLGLDGRVLAECPTCRNRYNLKQAG